MSLYPYYYNYIINDLMFYKSLHYTGHVLGLVLLYESFFTIPCFNYIYDQLVSHRVVEAFSFLFFIVSFRISHLFLIVNIYI